MRRARALLNRASRAARRTIIHCLSVHRPKRPTTATIRNTIATTSSTPAAINVRASPGSSTRARSWSTNRNCRPMYAKTTVSSRKSTTGQTTGAGVGQP
jgi:hypothetical protein